MLTVSGPDRLGWLHSLTTQHLEGLAPGIGVTTLVLSPQGHIEHALYGVDDGETFWAHTEPGGRPSGCLAGSDALHDASRGDRSERGLRRGVVGPSASAVETPWLDSSGTFDSQGTGRGGPDFVWAGTRSSSRARTLATAATGRAGLWAYEARRIAAGVPRIGQDSDHRTIPNELGLLGPAVHLEKGCYRGQETVARVHTLGRPPRRLVRLLLDGTAEAMPTVASPLELDGRPVGFVGSSARHFESGPIALGLVKRNVDPDATLLVDGIAAAQEMLVHPEIGLHVRPRL